VFAPTPNFQTQEIYPWLWPNLTLSSLNYRIVKRHLLNVLNAHQDHCPHGYAMIYRALDTTGKLICTKIHPKIT
jgi:hypothetical protein